MNQLHFPQPFEEHFKKTFISNERYESKDWTKGIFVAEVLQSNFLMDYYYSSAGNFAVECILNDMIS